MIIKPLLWFSVGLCVHAKGHLLDKKPDWLRLCRRSDPELNQCMKESLQTMFPVLANGIPEVEIEKFEPLFIKKIGISKGQGAVSLIGAMEDLFVHGSSNASVTDVIMDLNNSRWEFALSVPYLRLESRYNIKGNILLLPVVGVGDSTVHLRGCTCRVTCMIEMRKVEGREIIHVPHMDVDFSVAGMRLHLDNLFNGNKVLGQSVNQFLNKNAIQIVDELKKDIGEALSKVFVDILNNAFKHLPTDLWLPQE